MGFSSKNRVKILCSLIGLSLLLNSCASTATSEFSLENFEGFPVAVESADRSVANNSEITRQFYRGSRVSVLGLSTPGEIHLYPYLMDLRFERNRLHASDRNFMMTLSDERHALLEANLFDTGVDTNRNAELLNHESGQLSKCGKLMSTPHREAEGLCYYYGLEKNNPNQYEFQNLKYNEKPQIGSKSSRFGRNTHSPSAEQAQYAREHILDPNPRLISQELFARKNGIQKAESINVLAAAWLQAMNHDWFSHGKNISRERAQKEMAQNPEMAKLFEPFMIPDPNAPNDPSKAMMIPRTQPDLSRLSGMPSQYPVTFRNDVTHWWDASELYGADRKTILEVRTSPVQGLLPDGKLALDEKNRRLYYKVDGKPLTGFSDNWWTGLETIHVLFALEHNKIVDMLKQKYPLEKVNHIYFGADTSKSFTQEQLGEWYFQKARLIVAAEMARIHTVEWTPALLDNKALHVGMYANWHGLLPLIKDIPLIANALTEKDKQAFMGLTGPQANLYLYKAPFTLTEEFVAVYRMHSLIPDQMQMYNLAGEATSIIEVQNMLFDKAKNISQSQAAVNLLLSFGINNPGALTLNNYPEFIRNVMIKQNTDDPSQNITMDLGAVDVLRDRERMVPRYNEFRRQLGAALRNPAMARSIKQKYPNNALPLEPIKSFEELTNNPQHLAELKKVYGNDVEKLDLIVGTLAEKDRYAGFAFGNTPFYIFAIMASRRLMADPFFNKYYTAEVYTPEGLEWINQSNMKDVIVRNFPELRPKFKGVTNAFQPWNKTNR